MWYFVSPQIVFGEDALSALEELPGRRALLVADPTLLRLGTVERVAAHLRKAGLETAIFAEVEPEPSLATVRRGAAVAGDFAPDWVVGLGGGSAMDAAKAIWVLYERPDLEPAAINPLQRLGLRQKARLATIPTTSGTGAEVTWAIVLTDTDEQRKLGLGNRENVADIAVVDPALAASMPPQLTADTGLDALTHAVEAYTCAWHTDLTDGLAQRAARLVFDHLPEAVANGANLVARERLANAATSAGLAFGNAMASLAHAMGHALGGVFHLPHGRAVALCLPYTLEFAGGESPGRLAELAALCGYGREDEGAAVRAFAEGIRGLISRVGNPLTVAAAGVNRTAYEARLEKLVDDAFNDTQMLTAPRAPSYDELQRLFLYTYEGRPVDF
ncbi:MAG: iron-containing alcohol dehydrogenase [Chloroflexota bacterium]